MIAEKDKLTGSHSQTQKYELMYAESENNGLLQGYE